MPNDPYPEGRTQKSEFGTLLPDILFTIIKPMLAKLVSGGNITNKSSLHSAFRKETGSTVSFSTFNAWLEILEISFRKTVQIDGLVPAPTPGGAGVGPRPDVGEEDVKFDNEETFDFRPSRGFGDAFGEIARNSGGI
jgi:hypothetical protein